MARIKQKMGDRMFDVVNYTLLTLFLLAAAYPLYFMLIASISDPGLVLSGGVTFWPRGLNLNAYNRVFKYELVGSGYLNSIYYTVVGTAINLTLTLTAGFVISRKDLLGRRVIMMFFTITMFFGGGMIPTFLVVKELGLLNTIWGILLPSAVSTYNMILMRTFFRQIPQSLVEAAELDGCRDFGVLFKIVLPLSLASLMTIGMFYAVGHWNSYFPAVMYLTTNKSLNPLQIILRQVVLLNEIVENASSTENVMAEGIKYATIVVAMLPMLCVYPFVQRYFVKGVMVGSVKE